MLKIVDALVEGRPRSAKHFMALAGPGFSTGEPTVTKLSESNLYYQIIMIKPDLKQSPSVFSQIELRLPQTSTEKKKILAILTLADQSKTTIDDVIAKFGSGGKIIPPPSPPPVSPGGPVVTDFSAFKVIGLEFARAAGAAPGAISTVTFQYTTDSDRVQSVVLEY